METVSSIQELIRFIGAKTPNFFPADNMIVEIETWNNRIIKGSIHRGSEKPEVISTGTSCIDGNLLWSHVRNLLKKGKSFIVRNGPVDVCLFEWTINDN